MFLCLSIRCINPSLVDDIILLMMTQISNQKPRQFNFIHPETHTPQRKGLRSSALRPKKPEPAKQTGPVVIETWVAEEELDLWEIRAFSERSEGRGMCLATPAA